MIFSKDMIIIQQRYRTFELKGYNHEFKLGLKLEN